MTRREYRAASAFSALVCTGLVSGCASVSPFTRMSERECLTRAMYFESNRSSEDGMLAVGTVVMNRVASHRFPHSVCGVVGQPNQFAEGALSKSMRPSEAARVARVADAVLAGARHPGLGKNVMYFHTAGYTFPYHNMHYELVAGGNAFYEKVPASELAAYESATHTALGSPPAPEPMTPLPRTDRGMIALSSSGLAPLY